MERQLHSRGPLTGWPVIGKICYFAARKPGGTYFILDHEALPGTNDAGIAELHRIECAQVIREVTAAEFRLASEGNFLPLAGDDHSLSIFDTDQYALRFVKPSR